MTDEPDGESRRASLSSLSLREVAQPVIERLSRKADAVNYHA